MPCVCIGEDGVNRWLISDADSVAAATALLGYKTQTQTMYFAVRKIRSLAWRKQSIHFPVIGLYSLAHQEKAKNLQNGNTLERIEKEVGR